MIETIKEFIHPVVELIYLLLGTVFTSIMIFVKVKFVFVSRKKLKNSKQHGIINKKVHSFSLPFNVQMVSRQSMKVAIRQAQRVAQEIDNLDYRPTIMVGIGRGGAIFGSLISYNLCNTPIFCIDREYEWGHERKEKLLFDFDIPCHLIRRVLLVAGEAHSGGTMRLFYDYLKRIGAEEIKTCVFYKQTICTSGIDFHGVEGEKVSLMPWQDEKYIRDSLNRIEAGRLKR